MMIKTSASQHAKQASTSRFIGRRIVPAIVPLMLLLASSVFADLPARPKEETTEDKIKRAMAAAPADISSHATIIEIGAEGKVSVLRPGNNGWICTSGHPGMAGHAAMCF
ncbi:MAG TPA: hypothetical protein VEZ90_18655, partial [Blastocatellia bacterium]|nr:hypothetical protein [Blastocatellia bacterium]